tara:strand:- start:2 stop:607 length:606 start_codon:yes stop_codon:yes gene_type:complete
MKTLNDKSHLGVEGHVVIRDADSQEVLLNKYNAINFENFALAVANSMANQTTNSNNHFIAKLAFGFGGTTIDANGNVTYKDPKISGSTGGLYSPSPATIGANATTTPLQVSVTEFTVNNAKNQPYTDLECKVVLDYNQPDASGPALDNASDFDDADSFVFDEIALITDNGDFLTHLIFHPIQKSNNRKLEVLYTLRIRAGV